MVFPVLCVFANLTVEFIKKHNRASTNNGWLVAPPLYPLVPPPPEWIVAAQTEPPERCARTYRMSIPKGHTGRAGSSVSGGWLFCLHTSEEAYVSSNASSKAFSTTTPGRYYYY